jgi:uncharacterized protein (TIGR00255 family)
MIKSMTGYGKADFQIQGNKFDVEIKSVNHRFCEISFQNIPPELRHLELKMKKILSNRFARGHFYLSFHLKPFVEEAGGTQIFFNEKIVDQCFQVLSGLKKKFQLEGEITLSHLLVFLDQFVQKTPPFDFKSIEEHLDPLLDQAMTDLESMRIEEGKALAAELSVHLRLIKDKVKEIEEYRETVIQNYRDRLFKKIEEFKTGLEADPRRIAQEVVLFSDRMDINEEIARLISHLAQFEKMIHGNEPAGRGMDFLLQEMNREINTIGSKTGGTPATLFVKQELEILREQVQNVE